MQQQSFAAEPQSARGARRFVVAFLAEHGLDYDKVELVASELATNAVMHTDGRFTVGIALNDDVIRVEVRNDEPELLLVMREPSQSGGRGLRIIEALAVAWGAESERDSKVVWVEFAATAGDKAARGV